VRGIAASRCPYTKWHIGVASIEGENTQPEPTLVPGVAMHFDPPHEAQFKADQAMQRTTAEGLEGGCFVATQRRSVGRTKGRAALLGGGMPGRQGSTKYERCWSRRDRDAPGCASKATSIDLARACHRHTMSAVIHLQGRQHPDGDTSGSMVLLPRTCQGRRVSPGV